MKKALIIGGATAAALTPVLASAQMMRRGLTGWSMMGGWGIAGIIISIIFWVFVIWAIVMLVRWATWSGRGSHRHWHHWREEDSAARILKERYAKGEIKKEEFEEKMKDLSK